MTKWWWKANYIETCNCSHGCSCNLTMIPTDNTCQAVDAWQISEGEYDGKSTAPPSGFIWKDGVIVNTDSCVVNVPGLEFTHRNSSAFFSEVEYNT